MAGLGLGIGLPLVIALAAVSFFLYRAKKEAMTLRNSPRQTGTMADAAGDWAWKQRGRPVVDELDGGGPYAPEKDGDRRVEMSAENTAHEAWRSP